MVSSLIPDSPTLLWEEIVDKNHIDIVKSKIIGLGNVLEFFNKSGRIRSTGS